MAEDSSKYKKLGYVLHPLCGDAAGSTAADLPEDSGDPKIKIKTGMLEGTCP